MEMTARLTADATISTVNNNRQVVNFSVAINDRYKGKGMEQAVKHVTYIQCSYWFNPGIAPYLTKGKLVEMQGRISVSAYKGKDGEPKAALHFHVNTLKLHGAGGVNQSTSSNGAPVVTAPQTEDAPF